MIGQDAVATAQAFLDGVGYDGVVLTKLDGDARGGAALSITQLTGRPIMFASAGEKLEDFDLFHPDRMASRILDMGDMLTLIEQAEKAFDEEQTAALADRLVSGEGFTLEDFVEQIQMVRKLGPIGNLLGMLPGAGRNKELLSQVNDKDLDRATAIVQSMTPDERRNPKIINGSRRARIAGGSGVTPGQVSALIQNFLEGQKQMRQLLGGGLGNVPGLPPGMRRAANKATKSKKGKKRHPGGDPRRAAAKAAGNGAAADNAVAWQRARGRPRRRPAGGFHQPGHGRDAGRPAEGRPARWAGRRSPRPRRPRQQRPRRLPRPGQQQAPQEEVARPVSLRPPPAPPGSPMRAAFSVTGVVSDKAAPRSAVWVSPDAGSVSSVLHARKAGGTQGAGWVARTASMVSASAADLSSR